MESNRLIWQTARFVLAVLSFGFLNLVNAQSEGSMIIEHSRGKTEVKKKPQRVVIFDIGTLETYHELGIPVVGLPNNTPSYLTGFADTEKYVRAGSLVSVDKGKLEALDPDLIIISGRLGSQYDSLSMIAPTVSFSTEAGDYWNSFERNVRTIAALHGKEQLAEEKLAALRAKADKVRQRASADGNRTLIAMHMNGRFNPNGPNSRFGFPYDVLGMKPAYVPVQRSGVAGASPSSESQSGRQREPAPTLASINPDYLLIFDRATGIKDQMPVLEDLINEDIKATNAYRNNKVVLLPGMVWYVSGGGLVSVDKRITDIGEQVYGIRF